MYLTLTILTGVIASGSMAWAYYRTRDTFHPLVLMAPMLLALYVFVPLKLWTEDSLSIFFTVEQLEFVQWVNLLGVTCLCLGALMGDRKGTVEPSAIPELHPLARKRVTRSAMLLGTLGVLAFGYLIVNVGGLQNAFGGPHGGGWSDSGHVRDMVWLGVVAIVLIFISRMGAKLPLPEKLACLVFSMPFLVRGFLGARRGPTFVIFTLLGLGWYLRHGRRPRLTTLLVLGSALALLLLFIVSNRGSIYLGSDWRLDQPPTQSLEGGIGNEVVFGAGAILHASRGDNYYWGRRYFGLLFVRPIPRLWWPTKYEDFGVGDMDTQNIGSGGPVFWWTLGWEGPEGAYPGIVADMWLEFWWFSLLFLGVIGWIHVRVWRSAVSGNRVAVGAYMLMVSFMLFLVFQNTLEMLFRFLITGIPAFLVWRWANRKESSINLREAVRTK